MSEILPLVIIGIDIKDTMLSEISQKHTNTICFHLYMESKNNPTHHIHIYIYIYAYVCVHVCICVHIYTYIHIYVCMKVKLLSRIRLFVTPWTVAHQAPPSMGFSRQEYWSGLPFPYVYISNLIDTENMFVVTGGRGGRWVK